MQEYDAIIVGGGPAGSSAATCLATGGARVLVLEEKRMPREKLCGEFITPECFPTLERLHVMDRMLAAGARKIRRVCLVAANGTAVNAKVSEMSKDASWAMSLSRGRFDQILFDRAREAGAVCLEAIAVSGSTPAANKWQRVEALSLSNGRKLTFDAPLIIDASGRNSRLMVSKHERVAGRRGSRLYALKAHYSGIEGLGDQLELYFFPQGYGGVARVEDGLTNLCFIVGERGLKHAGGDPLRVVKEIVMNNTAARERLAGALVVGKWYSTGPLTFGSRRLGRDGVIAIGDASGMIDPFTGTGLQMALRTGEMAAEAILEALGRARHWKDSGNDQPEPNPGLVDSVLESYSSRYKVEFGGRLKVAGLLRTAAFSPPAAGVVAGVLSRAPRLASFVLRATRRGAPRSGAPG